jgi:hypothetical protein
VTKPLLQTLHDHAENQAMFALANEVLEVQKSFSPFDFYAIQSHSGFTKDDFRIRHVPSGLEYLIRFKAKGIDPFALSVTYEVSRLEADCDSKVIGTFESTFDTLRHILIDAIVDHHLRQLSRKEG